MNKATRLFDFSAGNAAIVIAAYLVLICLFSGLAATVQNTLPYLAITAVLVLSFVALFWYFYRRSVELGEHELRRGKQVIPRAQVGCEVFYNTRYREMTVRIYDTSKPDVTRICVQATKRNLRLLQNWLGYPLEIPQKNARK